MFKTMPFILIFVIIFITILNQFLPIEAKSMLYSISLTIKSFIIFLLPIIIFNLLFKAAGILAKDASKIIGLILLGVIISSYLACSTAYLMHYPLSKLNISIITPSTDSLILPGKAYYTFITLIPNQYALLSGIILGIITTYFRPKLAKKIGLKLESITNKLLKLITILIPLFIAGFVVKMEYEGTLSLILKDYTSIFILIALAQYSYIICFYFLLNNCKYQQAIQSLKNMLPATISGLSTMSSAATMPLTILGTEKNSTNKDLVHVVVPATVNIHLIGDCFATPCFAFAIMQSFGAVEPTIMTYLIFVTFFIVAKFSVAAVPGGGILVMLPVLEQHLGFNADMLSLITAVYILFDPVITGANILGNGAFAKACDKTLAKLTKK